MEDRLISLYVEREEARDGVDLGGLRELGDETDEMLRSGGYFAASPPWRRFIGSALDDKRSTSRGGTDRPRGLFKGRALCNFLRSP